MHHTFVQEFLLYGAFLLGVSVFLLQCAAGAIRDVRNPINRRLDYFYANWDVILVRTALGAALFNWWAHTGSLASSFGMTDVGVPVTYGTSFGFGYFVDSILKWAIKALAASPIGKWIPDIVQEKIPELPKATLESSVKSIPESNQRR
jgi:hypothetical protein